MVSQVSRAQPGGGVTPTGAHCCFEQEPGSLKVISSLKNCTETSSWVPPSGPTNRHTQSEKGKTHMSHEQVDSSPRDAEVTGGSPGGPPSRWHTRRGTLSMCPWSSSLQSKGPDLRWPRRALAPPLLSRAKEPEFCSLQVSQNLHSSQEYRSTCFTIKIRLTGVPCDSSSHLEVPGRAAQHPATFSGSCPPGIGEHG